MVINSEKIFKQAEKELAESGKLTIMVRRNIWRAMGDLEPREQDSVIPRTLTKPLKKRATLALACAKKVMPMWCAFAPDDKRPQKMLKSGLAYLGCKITVEELQSDVNDEAVRDFMTYLDNGELSASAALATWEAVSVAIEDESNLEPWCCDATDEEIDPYDWDAAKLACVAWSNAYTDGDNGKYAVREMRFWAWYLEEAAKILGFDNYRFPPKYIKAFQEKQNPTKPVPEKVTLENFCEFIGAGKYLYHLKSNGVLYGQKVDYYEIIVRTENDYGICPKCKKPAYKIVHNGMDSCLGWDDCVLPLKSPQIDITRLHLQLRCPDHPKEWIYSFSEYTDIKAAVKRYIKGDGRLEKLLTELECRKVEKYLGVWEGSIVVNGYSFKNLDEVESSREKLGIDGGWIGDGVYGLDLKQFSGNFFVYHNPFADFVRYIGEDAKLSGRGVCENPDGTVEFSVKDFNYKLIMENGQPVYAEIAYSNVK